MVRPLVFRSRQYSLRTLFKLIAGVAVLITVVGLLVMPPRVSMQLEPVGDNDFKLTVTKNWKVNSISSASLYLGDEVSPTSSRIRELPFERRGVSRLRIHLHDGPPSDDGQISRSLRPGENILLHIDYQYDTAIPPAACGGDCLYRFRVAADGSPEYIGRIY
jgi:hypothetical protein